MIRAFNPRRGVPPARISAAPLNVAVFVTLACKATRASVGIRFPHFPGVLVALPQVPQLQVVGLPLQLALLARQLLMGVLVLALPLPTLPQQGRALPGDQPTGQAHSPGESPELLRRLMPVAIPGIQMLAWVYLLSGISRS